MGPASSPGLPFHERIWKLTRGATSSVATPPPRMAVGPFVGVAGALSSANPRTIPTRSTFRLRTSMTRLIALRSFTSILTAALHGSWLPTTCLAWEARPEWSLSNPRTPPSFTSRERRRPRRRLYAPLHEGRLEALQDARRRTWTGGTDAGTRSTQSGIDLFRIGPGLSPVQWDPSGVLVSRASFAAW